MVKLRFTNNNQPHPPERSCIYMITYNQFSLADIFSDCQDIFYSDKSQFLSLLQQHIDLDEIVPVSFRKHFYASTGRTRKYPLYAFFGFLLFSVFFLSLSILSSLFSFAIPEIFGNSEGKQGFRCFQDYSF